MTERRARGHGHAAAFEQLQPRIEADLAESDDDTHPREMPEFHFQVIQAACDLFRQRFVIGRRTSDRGQDVCVREMQTIIGSLRRRDIRKPGPMQRRHQEIAGAVSCEDSSRPIGAMRGRCKPDQQQSCIRIAEARHWQSPVRVVTVCTFLFGRHATTVLSQSRTTLARHDRAVHLSE